ncbi:ABC transporter G family member 24 [Verticillium dahliae VDG1]|nr:ABC transporter G family member 24 [Verticillium dahliae VDG1]
MAAAATSTVPTGPNPAASATSQPFVSKWSSRYRGRKGRTYKVITMQTPLEELEAFFEAGGGNGVGQGERNTGNEQDMAEKGSKEEDR